ncbi:FAD-dependent oxidoreductase [Oceanicola sp. 22II-s10i]|uniref:FAD-binding oxidoreductase n=1 Tax=Oceanicola sp. 22II-s10i TaxID=1317116 RepID=UPI000B52564E|nr:FAD-binding oxidoreductase [Oceanicola sp. 22II-s10i]OWU85665.1 FAD-dependent oxidoreductase [Oceanicola sp. 22II-s10i]
MIDRLTAVVGDKYVLTGADCAPWATDFSGKVTAQPMAVVRPADTAEVAALIRLANETRTPVVPAGGRTGLTGATVAEGALVISLDRLNRVRDIRPEARVAVVEAGVVLSKLHETVEQHGLVFPLTFGARGSAMVGGFLSTNAGGSNVLRYGNARDLVLGIEAVLPSGEVLDLMNGLHKNNSGYDLRHLMMGAEGTLGIITTAVVKLYPKPRAYATAMLALPDLPTALRLLNQVQEDTGGAVEACEFMPGDYCRNYADIHPEHGMPFDRGYDVTVMMELGATAPRDCTPGPDGEVPLVARFEEILADYMEQGLLLDAVVARSEAQRKVMWARREAAAEVAATRKPRVTNDIAVELDRVGEFLTRADAVLAQVDPGADRSIVAHLGDGNIHYTVWPGSTDPAAHDRMVEAIEEIVTDMRGSFSAEHGIGTFKLNSMARRKPPVALEAMRAIKAALDPNGIMNPGKLIP